MFNINPKVSIVDEYLYKYVQRKSSAVHQITEKKISDQFKSQAIVCERLKDKVKAEELKANKFHIYTKNVLDIAKQRDKKLLDLVLKSEYVKNFYSKENYLYAKRLTNSFKLRFAYFIAYHKWFLIYSLICKFL